MSIKEMPFWKWALLLLASLILAVLLYGISTLTTEIGPLWLRGMVTVLVAAAMVGLYALFVKWFEKHPAADVPLNRLAAETGKGVAVGLGVFVLVVGVMMAFGCYRVLATGSNWQAVVSALFMFLIVAVGEEILARGVLFRWIDERWGFWVALMVSALLFGFMHAANDNATVWSSIAISIEAGLLLGVTYKWSGTLWMPIGLHWAWNFAQGNIFGFAVSGGDAGSSLLIPEVAGPEWLTGGAFGAEASVISVVVGAALSAWFIWRIYRP